MAATLDWGTALITDFPTGYYPVAEGGQRVFVVKNGDINFPTRDFRVWRWSGITSVGWLNTNPLALTVGIDHLLAAEDEHKFHTIVTLNMRLQADKRAWQMAAQGQGSLQILIEGVVAEAIADIFKCYPYRQIYNRSSAVVETLSDLLADCLKRETPYDLLNCRYEVEADDPAVDAAITHSKRTIALEDEFKATQDIEKNRSQRQRDEEMADYEHRQVMAEQAADDRRTEEAKEGGHLLTLQQGAADINRRIAEDDAISAASILERLVGLFGGDATLAALSRHPELLAKIRMAQIEVEGEAGRITYEAGQADGMMKAMTALLRDQNLSPEASTIRIISHTPSPTSPSEAPSTEQ